MRPHRRIARRVVTLLAAGELDGSQISEAAMDSSDVKRTLATGGVSSIAFASSGLEHETRESRGLISRFTNGEQANGTGPDEGDLTMKIHGLVRKAVNSRLTIPAEVDSAERSLIVVSGPPSEFSQKGLCRAREWLERETNSVEVLAGDDPRRGASTLSIAVLLSNVTNVERVEALQDLAADAESNIQQ